MDFLSDNPALLKRVLSETNIDHEVVLEDYDSIMLKPTPLDKSRRKRSADEEPEKLLTFKEYPR